MGTKDYAKIMSLLHDIAKKSNPNFEYVEDTSGIDSKTIPFIKVKIMSNGDDDVSIADTLEKFFISHGIIYDRYRDRGFLITDKESFKTLIKLYDIHTDAKEYYNEYLIS